MVAFCTQLLLLMHLTRSQFARVIELLFVRHRNTATGQQRNVYMKNEMMIFVTRYHKGYSRSGEIKLIYRYLLFFVGQLLVRYLWLIQPFVKRLEILYYAASHVFAFLWSHERWSRQWEAKRVREIMKRESLLTLRQKVNSQTYWHLTINISRRHFRTICYFEDEKNDLVADETSLKIVMIQQIAHSLSMIEITYARALQNQSEKRVFVRQRYCEVSLMRHLSSSAVHDRRGSLARQARGLSRPARLELDAQALTSLVRDEFFEAAASPVRRFRASSPFAGEESGAHSAREEFSADNHAHRCRQELALRSLDFVRD
jgi:Fe-S cluster assembly iron-binding protein IscA